MATWNAHRSITRRGALAALGTAGIGLVLAAQCRAAAQEATPTVPEPVGPLVSVVLDSALLTVPGGAAVSGHLVDEPGWSQTISFPTTSAAIVHVTAGAYSVRSDGPVVVIRQDADGAAVAESITPGQEATANAGGTMLYLSSSRIEESNRSDTPTDRYTFIVVGDGEPTIENPQGTTNGEFLAAIEPPQWSTLPTGPVTITFAIADPVGSGAATPVAGLQMVGELGGTTPRQLVISVSPGALPGATPVELATT